MDRDEAFALPYSWIAANKKNLNMTDRGEKSYWHVPITTMEDGNPGHQHAEGWHEGSAEGIPFLL
jgi:hypothetical protein